MIDDLDELLTEAEAAKVISRSVWFLRHSRSKSAPTVTPGPPYIRIGHVIRYRRADLDAWRQSIIQVVQPLPRSPKKKK